MNYLGKYVEELKKSGAWEAYAQAEAEARGIQNKYGEYESYISFFLSGMSFGLKIALKERSGN